MKFERKLKIKLIIVGLILIAFYFTSSLFNVLIVNRKIILILILVVAFFSILYYLFRYRDKEQIKNIIYIIFDYFAVIIYALFFIQLFFNFIMFPAVVNQTSMNPTLYQDERLIVYSGNKKIERFDIVVFRIDTSKNNALSQSENGSLWVKRVIGTPGSKIQYRQGKLYVNDKEVYEEYLYNSEGNFHDEVYSTSNGELKHYSGYTNDFDIVEVLLNTKHLDNEDIKKGVIPEDYYLLLGDNRGSSFDSREIGLVHKSLIIGEGKYVMKSLFDWKKIGD